MGPKTPLPENFLTGDVRGWLWDQLYTKLVLLSFGCASPTLPPDFELQLCSRTGFQYQELLHCQYSSLQPQPGPYKHFCVGNPVLLLNHTRIYHTHLFCLCLCYSLLEQKTSDVRNLLIFCSHGLFFSGFCYLGLETFLALVLECAFHSGWKCVGGFSSYTFCLCCNVFCTSPGAFCFSSY